MPPNSLHTAVAGEVMQCRGRHQPDNRIDAFEAESIDCHKDSDVRSDHVNASTRCLLLEQAYVHEVYAQICRDRGASSPVRSHIKEFVFQEFEAGSLLLDVGCGDGKYLNINPNVVTIGLERCPDWFAKSDSDSTQYLVADVTEIPFADMTFDGLLCCGVLHHISTTERRIKALREMSRLLKIGGKVLISVWAFEGRELESQDVLIRWRSATGSRETDMKMKSDQTSRSEMFSSDDNESSSSTCTSTAYVNRRAAYESCNSPTSEFGACYGCVPNTILPASPPLVRQSRSSVGESPIELHNQCQPVPRSHPCPCDSHQPMTGEAQVQSTTSIESSEPRRLSLKEQCGSFVSMIRENILSKAIRVPEENQNVSSSSTMSAAVGKLLHHISNLPVIGILGSKRPDGKTAEFTLHNDQQLSMPHEDISTHSGRSIDHEESAIVPDEGKESEDEVKSLVSSKKTFAKFLQKSLSSDSLDSKKSRQHSLITECSMTMTTTTANTSGSTYTSSSSSRLVAYYSMPELRSLERLTDISPDSVRNLRGRRSGGPRLTDLHPITFLDVDEISLPKAEVRRECSQDTEAAIDEMEILFRSVEVSNSKCSSSLSDQREDRKNDLLLDFPQVSLCPEASSSVCLTIEGEEESDRKSQRSCSVEYKAKISPSHRQNLRRFSASPNLCVPRTLVHFFQEQNLHETHPSVDSEESFVTVIPAERSCRGSIDVMNMNENDLSYVDDVLDEVDPQTVLSEDMSDVLCESRLATVRLLSPLTERSCSMQSHRSQESVVPPCVPSSGASTPSPPTKLHRYFHLFRSGELEDLIANNLEGLHLLRSYYSEHATSWCVVCEKVQVWAV